MAILQQVAIVGNISPEIIINSLREATGQKQTNDIMDTTNNLREIPEWFDVACISDTLDAREMLQAGQHPLGEVISRTAEIQSGQIFELITPFSPMPLIGKITEKGFMAFVKEVSANETHTFFCKVK